MGRKSNLVAGRLGRAQQIDAGLEPTTFNENKCSQWILETVKKMNF